LIRPLFAAACRLGSGRLDGLRDCVRRGRMIRCRVCGEKGATLGCHKATCRSSYHLPCARRHHCLLQASKPSRRPSAWATVFQGPRCLGLRARPAIAGGIRPLFHAWQLCSHSLQHMHKG
jgi:hypothetical protein